MNCTSIPTNAVSMVPVLANVFHITFLHMHLNRLRHAFNRPRPFSSTIFQCVLHFTQRKRANLLTGPVPFMCPDVSGSRRNGAKVKYEEAEDG